MTLLHVGRNVFNHTDVIFIKYVLQDLFSLFSKFGLKRRQNLEDIILIDTKIIIYKFSWCHEFNSK